MTRGTRGRREVVEVRIGRGFGLTAYEFRDPRNAGVLGDEIQDALIERRNRHATPTLSGADASTLIGADGDLDHMVIASRPIQIPGKMLRGGERRGVHPR